jgi:hypothetical protein
MTAEEWQECADPKPMLVFLRGKVSDRKLRLFACASCRQIWSMHDQIGKRAVEFAERHAEGEGTADEQSSIESLAWWGADGLNYEAESIWFAGWAAHSAVSGNPIETVAFVTKAIENIDDIVLLCGLVKDIFGNPFRPVALDPRWLSCTVVDFARAIYDERAFDQMPVLADALVDAGCDNEEIIAHCLSKGPHVRGCWVVDLLLGKT